MLQESSKVGYYYYPHLRDQETDAQGNEAACLRSYEWSRQESNTVLLKSPVALHL